MTYNNTKLVVTHDNAKLVENIEEAREDLPLPKVEFKALHNRLVVKRIANEATSPGGIIIPDAAKEKPDQATVLATGPGKRDFNGTLIPTCVEVGDTILFSRYAGSEINLNGEDLLVISEDDVMLVLV